MSEIRIFDTTLRDGEQSPGASLNHAEKLEIARQLETLGVDVIEAGFPITSNGDFEAVKTIAQEVRKPIIAGLARAVPMDVQRAGEAVKHAANGRIHVFCATSKIHRERKLKKAFEEIIRISVEQVQHAREYVDDVEFSPEDASRTELEYLVDITAAVIEAGATTINLPDTVGYATPQEYGRIFSYLREQLPIIDEKGIILSTHCHNDLGLAVANSIAGVENGAKQVECTVNGIGERAGNAALEELVMAFKTRGDFYQDYTTNIDTQKIYPTSRMVSQLTGLQVQRNKAVVGRNAFAHESGIHQDGVLKHRETYEIMNPLEIGLSQNELVLGKHSGRHALKDRLNEMGYTVDDDTLIKIYDAFKVLADKKKSVYDEDIEALVERELDATDDIVLWKLKSMQVMTGSMSVPTATITMTDTESVERTDASTGHGPIEAVYNAIGRITNVKLELLDYQIRSVSRGRDAQGEVAIVVNHNGMRVSSRGVSTDIIEASALAYITAINRIRSIDRRQNLQTGVEKPVL